MKIIPPQSLLEAYAQGIFPMAQSRDDEGVDWYTAPKRGIIPLSEFRVSKNVARIIRNRHFEVRIDTCFREVMEGCAERESTWINDIILNSYTILHQHGFAHSVEVFKDERLVGGLYGVALGGAFFGESMFKRAPEADKVALYWCHQVLVQNGFTLWDTQFYTDHLGRFGAKEINQVEYKELLEDALGRECVFGLGGDTI
ncbi:MAG: leucyl/phenylalanyl-tRNA--protein transferase [Bacteroidota bacterium]